MLWPQSYETVSLPIILPFAETVQYHILQKKDNFPSESSEDINPLLLKLYLAAVVFVWNQSLWTSWHILPIPVFLQCPKPQHHTVLYTPRQLMFSALIFSIVVYNKKDIRFTLPWACFKCSTLQKLRDRSISTLTKGRLASNRLSTSAEWQQGPQLALPQQQCRAAGLKRCLVDVWHLSLRVLINKKPSTDWQNSYFIYTVYSL